MDTVSPQKRSANMRRIKSKGTAPERRLGKLIRSLRFKFNSHVRKLPGKPDFVFTSRRRIVFLHGCFWHAHGRCKLSRIPKSKLTYWMPKLMGNKKRDLRNMRKLRSKGWKVLTVWECQLASPAKVKIRLRRFLTVDKRTG